MEEPQTTTNKTDEKTKNERTDEESNCKDKDKNIYFKKSEQNGAKVYEDPDLRSCQRGRVEDRSKQRGRPSRASTGEARGTAVSDCNGQGKSSPEKSKMRTNAGVV